MITLKILFSFHKVNVFQLKKIIIKMWEGKEMRARLVIVNDIIHVKINFYDQLTLFSEVFILCFFNLLTILEIQKKS